MRQKLYGGIGASLALHVIIAAVLFVRLPAAEPVPPEESVSVEIVPPPEPAPPEEPPAEEQPLDLTMPEEKPEEQAQEIPPPPEPPKQEAEEAGGEPPSPQEAAPQAEEAEQAEAEPAQAEAPPPPPPAAEQQAEAEAPPPPPPAPEQPQAEQPQTPPPGSDQAAEQQEQPAEGQPLPVLRPVFEFGDEEAGSEVAQDGSSSEDGSEAAADTEATETETETAESASEAPEPPAPTTEAAEEKTEPPAPALPQDVAPPSIDIANADPLAMSENGTAEGVQADISTEPSAAPESDAAADGEAKPSEKPPTEAKRLFSQRDTDDPVARTAMGSIPRDIRASQLCATELREQLRHGQPAYQPELLPSYRLPEGTVLDIRQAAFRANDQWYNISFRCEIDEKATKVVSFGFDVGNTVPRSEWGTRGFPQF